jgi:hypothetical protein
MPIAVKSDDQCYQNKTTCLNYIRSFRSFDQCDISSPPSLTNFHTPYLDLELVYNENTLKHLEENRGTFDVENVRKMEELLVGFDHRSSQLPGLFLYLNFFVRLHNIIFREFTRVRPTMSRANATHETRRIVTAAYQRITIELIQATMGLSN